MANVSVVIACRNEAPIIGRTISSLRQLSDDIVIYDNGSTDGTQDIARSLGVRVFEGPWEGFGPTKSKANSLARYDWILSLDADETPDEELVVSIQNLNSPSDKEVFDIAFRNFLGDKYLRYGEWGGDHHIRLFNRNAVKWDNSPVHESLVLPKGVIIKKLNGHILHRTVKNIDDYGNKMSKYAMLNAEKYYQQGKKSTFFQIRIKPTLTFLNYYIFKLGFLDGYEGYVCARMTAWYTFLKYARLKELWKGASAGSQH